MDSVENTFDKAEPEAPDGLLKEQSGPLQGFSAPAPLSIDFLIPSNLLAI